MEEVKTKENNIHTDLSENEAAARRKRINRYKKMILRTLLILVIISIVLWIYIIFKIEGIEDKINGLGLTIMNGTRRIIR